MTLTRDGPIAKFIATVKRWGRETDEGHTLVGEFSTVRDACKASVLAAIRDTASPNLWSSGGEVFSDLDGTLRMALRLVRGSIVAHPLVPSGCVMVLDGDHEMGWIHPCDIEEVSREYREYIDIAGPVILDER